MNFLRLLAICIFLCPTAYGQQIDKDSVKQRLITARTYIMVLLEEGKNKPREPETYDQMVFEHLGFLYQLQSEGKILEHGQVLTGTRLTAAIIFNTHNEYDVKKMIEKSELIQKGYMTYKTFRWFGEPGQFSIFNNHK